MDPETKTAELKSLLLKFRPQTLLAVGPAAEEFCADYLREHPEADLQQAPGPELMERLHSDDRYDLAIVSHTLEHMDKQRAIELVARLRDVHARRLLLVVPVGTEWTGHQSRWERSDLLGLGFVEVSRYEHGGKPVEVYAFDIATYKTTPEWLNAKYWAHPELFGKYWW